METVLSAATIRKEVFKGDGDGAKGDFIPRDFILPKQSQLKGFGAGGEVEIQQSRAINNMYLMNMRHADQRVHVAQFDAGAGFFQRFTQGGVRDAFPVFHEAGGQCPLAMARLDGAPAKQYTIFPYRQGTDHEPGVAIMNRPAGIANMAREGIPWRNSQRYGCPADAAIIDCRFHLFILARRLADRFIACGQGGHSQSFVLKHGTSCT